MATREKTAIQGMWARTGAGGDPRAAEVPALRRRAGARRPPSRLETRLAEGLGWFSIGLGLTELLVPGPLARLIGVRPQPGLLRLLGLREAASGVAILTRRRPTWPLWSRVAGDAVDLGLLGAALRSGRSDRARVAAAAAAVGGVTALDVLCAVRLTRQGQGLRTRRVVKTLAVNRSPAECYALWRDPTRAPSFMRYVESVSADDERCSRWTARGPGGRRVRWAAEVIRDEPDALIAWRSLPGGDIDTAGTVEFSPRPGRTGTLVRVAMVYSPPAGPAGALVARLYPGAPEHQLAEDLRRFKRLLETGELPTTTGQPAGPRGLGHRALAWFFSGGAA